MCGKSHLLNAIVDPSDEIYWPRIFDEAGRDSAPQESSSTSSTSNVIRCATIEGGDDNLVGNGQTMTLCDMPGLSRQSFKGAARFAVERAIQQVIEHCGHITKIFVVQNRHEVLKGSHIQKAAKLIQDMKLALMMKSATDNDYDDILEVLITHVDHPSLGLTAKLRKLQKKEWKKMPEIQKENERDLSAQLKDNLEDSTTQDLIQEAMKLIRGIDGVELSTVLPKMTWTGDKNRDALQALLAQIALVPKARFMKTAPNLTKVEHELVTRAAALQASVEQVEHDLGKAKADLYAATRDFNLNWGRIVLTCQRGGIAASSYVGKCASRPVTDLLSTTQTEVDAIIKERIVFYADGQVIESLVEPGSYEEPGFFTALLFGRGHSMGEVTVEEAKLVPTVNEKLSGAASFGVGALVGFGVKKGFDLWNESKANEKLGKDGQTKGSFMKQWLQKYEDRVKEVEAKLRIITEQLTLAESVLSFIRKFFENFEDHQ